jgi:anti-sigma factor RsiW
MKMTRDELEYAISQYLDGTLMPLERDALEEHLATDADARAILEEYRKLNTALKSTLPEPAIAWDRLAAEISRGLQEEETPIRHYSLHQSKWVRGLAIAASLLLVVSIVAHFAPTTSSNPSKPSGTLIVAGPAIEQSAGPVVSEISIGHSETVAQDWRAAEEVISRPSVVLIDQARPSGQDGDPVLY